MDPNLQKLGKHYWTLCGNIRKINRAFGIQLTAVFLSVFIHIIVTPYYLFLTLIDLDSTADDIKFIFCQGLWIAIYLLQLFIVVLGCSSTAQQAKITIETITKFLNEKVPDSWRKELESLLFLLVHQMPTFSACGLFNIDLPLITSVAGSVTTYLVILIQFQATDSLN